MRALLKGSVLLVAANSTGVMYTRCLDSHTHVEHTMPDIKKDAGASFMASIVARQKPLPLQKSWLRLRLISKGLGGLHMHLPSKLTGMSRKCCNHNKCVIGLIR